MHICINDFLFFIPPDRANPILNKVRAKSWIPSEVEHRCNRSKWKIVGAKNAHDNFLKSMRSDC
jgi:adenylate cyclase